MISTRRSAASLATASLFALAAASAAVAQTPPAPVQAAAADDAGLGEIVITAQRRAENLQNVPLSVTAIGTADLEKNDIRDLSRVEILTPGFSFGRSGSDARPAIRGVRTENVGASGDPSIGFYVDNIYQSRAAQANVPFVDVQRVEIQRGPQGTLYGRNTFGGNIALTTQAPTDKLELGVSGLYGSFNRFRVDGFANAPLTDGISIRVAGLRETMDGYVKGIDSAHDIYDLNTTYFRGSVRVAPADSGFEAVLRYSYWLERGTGGGAFGYRVGGIYVNPQTGVRDINGTPYKINPKALDGIPDVAGIDLGFPVDNGSGYPGNVFIQQRVKQQQASANLSYDFGPVVLRSITGYTDFSAFRNADNDFSPRVLNEDFQSDHLHTISEELQLASSNSKDRFQWILGAFYLRDNIFQADFYSFPQTNRNGTAINAHPLIKSWAGFAQASYWIAPDVFRVTGGIRYSHDQKIVTRDIATIVDGQVTSIVPNINPNTGTAYTPFDLKFKKTTWRVNAEYYVQPENMLYATVSTGFRSGGFNGGNFTNPAIPGFFQPETVTAYEIGSKNRFLDNALQLNIAAYYNDFKNLQVQNQFLIPAAGGGFTTSSAILNAASARSKGVEIELQARPLKPLNLGASMTISDAKFKSYKGAPAPALYTTIAGGYDLSGNRVPYNARFKATGFVSYDIELGSAGRITPQATLLYSGDYYLTDFNKALDHQKGYAKLDLRVTYATADERFTLEAFVNNVTDKVALNRATFGSGGVNSNFDAPRMFGVKAGFRY